MPELEDKPIQKEYMTKLAVLLDAYLNDGAKGQDRRTGFVLLVYPFAAFDEGDSRCNYVSNGADRKDIVVLMREMIARFEGQPYQKGTA